MPIDIGQGLQPAVFKGPQVAALAHIGGWSTKDQVVTATAIAMAESGGVMKRSNAKNKNGTYDWGVWQINDIHKPTDKVKDDARENARWAYKIWVDAGHSFKPWSTYNSGSYKKHLKDADKWYEEAKADPTIENRLRDGDVNTGAGGSGSNTGISNIKDGVPNAISGAVNSFNETFAKLTFNLGAVLVAVVLLILGFIILIRGPIGGIVGAATPVGRVAKVARKVG